jgi:hypothetical protein
VIASTLKREEDKFDVSGVSMVCLTGLPTAKVRVLLGLENGWFLVAVFPLMEPCRVLALDVTCAHFLLHHNHLLVVLLLEAEVYLCIRQVYLEILF